MKYPATRILLFAREPVSGRVKTRLIPVLGEEGAMDLYVQLLQRQMGVLGAAGLCPVQLWVDGDSAHPVFADFAGERHRQDGADLGQRMYGAVRQALREADAAIIIGSDCPALDRGYLARAAAALAEGAEAVLGPAEDGGYVLIGLRRCTPGIFEGVEWGGARVLRQTLARLAGEAYRVRLLPPLTDIDRPGDLEELARYGIFPRISRPLLADDNDGQ